MKSEILKNMAAKAEVLLHDNILRFWIDRMQDPKGGFYGRMDGQGHIVPDAPKGSVLNARLVWTFAAAFRATGRKEYLAAAERAMRYFCHYFIDKQYGGVYWSVTAQGEPLDDKKQVYATAFAIYGLTEYARAASDATALHEAVALYDAMEQHSFDPARGGYLDAMTRAWEPIADMRLSPKDDNAAKTMNTHLHILEAYTNLYRVWPDTGLREKLIALVRIFTDHIYNPATGHQILFFDEAWRPMSGPVSYGHDIEASWLIWEAVQVLGDGELEKLAAPVVAHIASAAGEGLQADGSMAYELHPDGSLDADRHWWVQAETVVGYLWRWRFFGDGDALERSSRCLDYIESHLVDPTAGEWWWSIKADGTINKGEDKAGPWKCPYHNARMCLEILDALRG